MKTSTLRLLTGFLFFFCISYSYAQNAPVITTVQGKLIRTTPPLNQIEKNTMYGAPLKITRSGDGFAGGVVDPERAEEGIHKNVKGNSDPVVLSKGFTPSLNAPTSSTNLNFDGQIFPGFAPSDNNLAVGPNHVIQIINHSSGSAFKIWDKSGNVVQNSTVLSTITGVTGGGDPVVLYDQLADRWVLTEFGFSGGVTSYINTLIIAVSTTANPTGSWKVYSYNVGTFFVDYPKYSVWQNAYYATSNDFNTAGTSYLGSSIYAFDRSAMLAGAPTATMIRSRLNNASTRYYSMAPVCMEGNTTSNQSGLFAFLQDNTWVGGSAQDSIFLFEFTPNFASPASSVIGPFRAMKTNLAFNTNTGNLSQPSPGGTIQALNQRLMHKVIYRNFGSSESIVCNTVDLQGTGTGVHWWEFRRTGGSGNWNIYQEGLYHPDNNNRFMGSIAINANGDIGLLYNVVSSSVYPSARFTGRSSCDPLGQMTLTEQTVQNGSTYEASNNRYGDYNTLSIDPVNGSFWGTAQYNSAGAGTYGNWRTRMVNFTLTSSCGGGGNPGTVSGTTPLCIGQTATYSSNGDPGGSWSSSNTSVATVNTSSGLVTPVATGTTNITYTVGGNSSFKALTVNPNVNAGTISGTSPVCVNGSANFTTNGDAGGTWSSDDPTIASVNSSGVVSGVAVGSTTIRYTISSGCGSPSAASKPVDVVTCSTPTVSCPANITTSTTSGCSKSVTTPDPTTTNTTSLSWTITGATSASGTGNVGTRTFNIGVSTITYTASNGSASDNCSFTVTVNDNTPASITCPANIDNTQNGNGRCSANINVPGPNTSGNCSVASITWTATGAFSGSGSGSVGTQTFPVGITTITYTVTNGGGNTTSCSFTVTVRNRKCPNSPNSPEVITENNSMGTSDKLTVQVFPNPSETYFTLLVQSPRNEKVEISVYTVSGKLVQRLKGNASDVFRFGDDYTAGAYIVKVQQGAKQSIVKVVK